MQVTIPGIILADGSLQLESPISLPAGKVRVVIESEASGELPKTDDGPRDNIMDVLKEIWAGQAARGYKPRSAEEIHAQLAAMDEEWNERQSKLEEIQLQCASERRLAAEKSKAVE